jgi:uncharacterized membrane protein YdjX (TVP38/TMEM64 family)
MAEVRSVRGRIPSKVWLRLLLFVAMVLVGMALYHFTPIGEVLAEVRLLALIETLRGIWWAPLLLIGLFGLVSVLGLPPVPLLVAGAAFGALYGSIFNMVGLLVGAFLAYWVARLLGRDFVIRATGKRFRRAETLFERHGFWPLVQTRFMPLPFAVVNFGAALAGVRPMFFLIATTVGLIPSTLIHTYFIAEAIRTQGRERAIALTLYAGAFVLFNALLSILWLRERTQRRRRYRELVAVRAERRMRNGSAGNPQHSQPLDRQ